MGISLIFKLKQPIISILKRKLVLFLFIFSPIILWAQKHEVKVDLDQVGRSQSEVNQLGYQAWTIGDSDSKNKKFKGLVVRFSVEGLNGFHLKTDWYKAGIHEPYYAKLISDGITVDDEASGHGIVMTLKGLT